MASFLQDHLIYTSKQESPELFHFWTGVTIIAAALGRRCWIDQGYFKVYPNVYCILVAGSAVARKSVAEDIGMELLRSAKIDDRLIIFKNRITCADISHEMSKKRKEEMVVDKNASDRMPRPLLIFSREVSLFLSREAKSSGILDFLNEVYDCPPEYEHRTKTAGSDFWEYPCVNILSGTTPDWIADNLQTSEMKQGFMARTFVVFQPDRRFRNARPKLTQNIIDAKLRLIDKLSEFAYLEGEGILTPEADEFYVSWYETTGSPKDERLDGFYGKMGNHVLKLGLIFSVSAGTFPTIHKPHLEAAVEAVNLLIQFMPGAFVSVAPTPEIAHPNIIEDKMMKFGTKKIARSDLLRAVYHKMKGQDFEQAINTLLATGKITREISPMGGKELFTLNPEKTEGDSPSQKTSE